jgi:Tfp pilus assembly protein FimT
MSISIHTWQVRFRPPGAGSTLLELITVLALLGLVLAELLPAARSQMDRMAVLGAREDVAGLLQRARAEAVARGGATLVLAADPPSAEVRVGQEILAWSHLDREYGVTLSLSRNRPRAVLVFDPLGLGRISGQTLRFRRNGVEARLVVSSLGRVTRP